MDPPPDRLRVRGEPVEAGPAGWKEPCLGATDGQNKLASRFTFETSCNGIELTLRALPKEKPIIVFVYRIGGEKNLRLSSVLQKFIS